MSKSLIDLFYPPVCAGCDALLLVNEKAICTTCRHEMPQTYHHLTPENEAFKKFYGKIHIEFAATFLHYHKRGIVQQMIHSLKYHGAESVGTTLGQWYGSILFDTGALFDVDEIIPVPLHPKKLRERGYNQVTAFGMALADRLGVAYNDRLLVRKKYSKTQTKKNLMGRNEVRNQEIFGINSEETHQGKHLLLVDDVLTTGATLESCARVLQGIPNTKISIVCMAMSHS
ncbi:ComF family protein [Flavobacterium caeni]|uniref:ComF family protein n=1 Tax=Flavobacterium caeni TaxID=490189 RepID=A0A1G5H4H0_9FLAO|nr:ComF family protein [Flavobacterium caeni]SCY58250.1 comF family protein [Flavobacterium caeni]